jgi:uncharacterized protein
LVSNSNHPFRLNVGFIVHQAVGYSRDFSFEFPFIAFPPDLELNDLKGEVRVTRTAQGLLLQASTSANAKTECASCLDECIITLSTDFTELYAFSQNSVTDSELLLPENNIIDLEPIVREEMLLAFPIKPLCRPDCQGLCPICGENRNTTACNHENDYIDPRLEALRTLLEE